MCAESRLRDLRLARTVRESAGLPGTWAARLQNRGLQVRFLPGLLSEPTVETQRWVLVFRPAETRYRTAQVSPAWACTPQSAAELMSRCTGPRNWSST